MNAAVKIEIDKAVRAIKNSVEPQKIFLFGSHAAGSATQDSDIDLCVVTSLQGMRKIEALRKMRRAMMNEVNLPVDLLIPRQSLLTSPIIRIAQAIGGLNALTNPCPSSPLHSSPIP